MLAKHEPNAQTKPLLRTKRTNLTGIILGGLEAIIRTEVDPLGYIEDGVRHCRDVILLLGHFGGQLVGT